MATVEVSKTSWLNRSTLLSFNGSLFWDQTDLPDVPFADDDTYIQLSDIQAKRIDLVAFEQYGESELMWIIMLANDKNAPNQFIGGEQIRIPSQATIDKLLNTQT